MLKGVSESKPLSTFDVPEDFIDRYEYLTGQQR